MSNTSYIITNTARSQPTSIIGHPRPRQAENAEPTQVQDRARVGRFDDGMSTYPDRNRAHVGRFDDGMSTYPDRNRAHVGRFDDGMTTASEHGQAPIGTIDRGTVDDALAA
jgi:hypothetical protein